PALAFDVGRKSLHSCGRSGWCPVLAAASLAAAVATPLSVAVPDAGPADRPGAAAAAFPTPAVLVAVSAGASTAAHALDPAAAAQGTPHGPPAAASAASTGNPATATAAAGHQPPPAAAPRLQELAFGSRPLIQPRSANISCQEIRLRES